MNSPSQPTLTDSLAAYIVAMRDAPLDARTADAVTDGFVDCAGTMMAGRNEPVVEVLTRLYGADTGPGGASLLFGERRLDPQHAALINAAAGHALDYDDVAFASHPSVVMVPALLAEGEVLGSSGMAMLRAYHTGFEVWAELIFRDADPHFSKGWHPTAVFGTVATAAAIASLRGFDHAQCRTMLSLAASCAGGVIANFGTMAKPFHAGKAAAAALACARLVLAGMTAADDALGAPSGLLRAISPQGKVETGPATPLLGQYFAREGICFKKYPLCYATHRVIDAATDLHREQLDWSRITRVDIELGDVQYKLLKKQLPKDALEAKFSIEFAFACGLRYGTAELRHLDPGIVTEPAMIGLMGKVEVTEVRTTSDTVPGFSHADRVRITLDDGRVVDSGERSVPRGHALTPATREELKMKFFDCCDFGALEHAQAERIYARLIALGSA